MHTRIEGELLQILFASQDSGYTVARFRPKGQTESITVVGNLLGATPGEVISLEGQWTHHKRFGRQFQASSYRVTTPTTVEGIERYLSSGLIKGIGPVMARRLTGHFGERTLEIIEHEPERLAEVEGIGPVRIAQIRGAWEAQRDLRRLMLFLQEYGVGSALAARIYKQYGDQAIPLLKENPYRLASEVFGIGFKTADRIAQAMGVDARSLRRAEAGLLYVLEEAANHGHVYVPYTVLLQSGQQILGIQDTEILTEALAGLFQQKRVIIEDLNEDMDRFRENNKGVYLPAFHTAESGIARHLGSFLASPHPALRIDPSYAVARAERSLGFSLASEQKQALERALKEKFLIITGGPGTGKTTLVRALVSICKSFGLRCLLAAPTGRAAKRLQEVTGEPAKTIHRLLEYRYQKGGFLRGPEHPLSGDLVIVDEASMIDCLLAYHLIKALPPNASFILIGDINQLPSVGAGRVLDDLIESGVAHVVRLTRIFRQAMESMIITNAHRVYRGELPLLSDRDPHGPKDFCYIEEEDPERVAALILDLCAERIPKRFGFDPIDDIQVICPMHKGVAGAENLNALLQERLNPKGRFLRRGGCIYRIGDKVMQIRNNYDKEVFNGDIGRIHSIDEETNELSVLFDGRSVVFDASELEELVPAYAISVHKSQGNEYPAVVLPLLTQHYLLLQRNLLYTAITRGKKLVVIVGTKKAVAIAVRNDKTQHRFTFLKNRLAQLKG